MKIGTKSLLYGAHCFFIHPLLVAVGWKRLYGFPFDPRLWVAFIVHDWGYWAKPNMDGDEGESHVEAGAKIMEWLFGSEWGDFTKYHSGYYARKHNAIPSRLCYADKLALCYEWEWFYLLRTRLTGEIKEYVARTDKYGHNHYIKGVTTPQEWLRSIKHHILKNVATNK